MPCFDPAVHPMLLVPCGCSRQGHTSVVVRVRHTVRVFVPLVFACGRHVVAAVVVVVVDDDDDDDDDVVAVAVAVVYLLVWLFSIVIGNSTSGSRCLRGAFQV